MDTIEIKMPKMGESMTEATIINWLKSPGDAVTIDETILEIATDKVDSEVPSPVTGILKEVFFKTDAIVTVDTVLAVIEIIDVTSKSIETTPLEEEGVVSVVEKSYKDIDYKSDKKFFSPLVRNIAKLENISLEELKQISSTGNDGRLRKSDLMKYLSGRNKVKKTVEVQEVAISKVSSPPEPKVSNFVTSSATKTIKMDRMRKIIADHMVYSKQTSPHVTAFIEVDVTDMVKWRNANKNEFLKKYGEKLTFTPIFIEAVTCAIRDYPLINVSVKDKDILVHQEIHIGMATALPSGNLIVPVVRNANQKNILGLAKDVNRLANKARNNNLSPDEIRGSTFTISNVGTFGSLMGTPIINQPEAAILAIGIIKKRAEVMETENGDVIAIRQMMYLSLSFDHRVIDGYLGGSFLKKIGDYLENFDKNKII